MSGMCSQVSHVFGREENVSGPLLSHCMAFCLPDLYFQLTLPCRSLRLKGASEILLKVVWGVLVMVNSLLALALWKLRHRLLGLMD